MIMGKAMTFKSTSNIPLIAAKIYLIALFCQLISLNFKLKRGNSETSSNDRIIQIATSIPAEILSGKFR